MAWRVLRAGAMIEILNGVTADGRELTSTAIVGEGQVIEKDLPKAYVQRYLDGDEYVRSTVEYGEIETQVDEDGNDVVDEDGNDVKGFVPKGGPEAPEGSASAPAANLQDADEAAQARIQELEDALGKASNDLSSSSSSLDEASGRIAELEAKVDELEKDLDEASAPQAFPYDKLSSEALAVEAERRGVTPASGSGSNGNVVKADLVKALTEADAA